MPQRAAYYRGEANKCRSHADNVMDAEVRPELLKLATEYIERAAEREKIAKNAK
jgi:hypothetical protein